MERRHQKGRSTRHPVAFTAEVRDSHGRTFEVAVENFSLDGCCIGRFLPTGEKISIQLPRMGTFEGMVCWSGSGRAGLRFHRNPGPKTTAITHPY